MTLPGNKVYTKADSFSNLSGVTGKAAIQAARIHDLAQLILSQAGTEHRRGIIGKAIDGLLGNGASAVTAFRLQNHVVAELERLRDNELARYLFYRYRYDVYPAERVLDDFPPCVQIEPTSICNYRCVFCYQTDKNLTQGRHGHMGMMSLDTFKRVVDQIHGEVEAVTLASRGEPLMAKDIVPMLEYLSGKFLGLKINTNASFLTEEKAHALLAAEPNTVVFSADAADPALYARLRVNGSLEKVFENVRKFTEIKAKHYSQSRTITRVSGVRYSEEQSFEDIEKFWHDYVDQVAFVEYNPWENPYDQDANGMTDVCSDLWRRMFVWWDGRANPCDVDYRSTLAVGNIAKTSLSDLWHSPAYRNLREAHLQGNRQSSSPCKSCVVV